MVAAAHKRWQNCLRYLGDSFAGNVVRALDESRVVTVPRILVRSIDDDCVLDGDEHKHECTHER